MGRLGLHCGRGGVSGTSAREVMLALGECSGGWTEKRRTGDIEHWGSTGPGSPGTDGQGKQRLGAVETEIVQRGGE